MVQLYMEPGGWWCPNGVQHTVIKFPSYCGGGGPKVDRGC